MAANKTSQVAFANEADLEKAVLERLRKVLPDAVHAAVQACLVAPVKESGIHKPKPGGKCAAVWEVLDQLRAAGTVPSVRSLEGLAKKHGFNLNNTRTEYYLWRRFNHIGSNNVEHRSSERRVGKRKVAKTNERRAADRREVA